MSYENSSAMHPLQNDHKLLQNLSQIPAPAYGVAVVLGMCAFDVIPPWACGAILIVGFLVWNASENARKMKEAKAMAAAYSNLRGPQLVASNAPDETLESLAARAAEFRQKIKLSGNPYAHLIEVVEYPFQPLLSDYGQLYGCFSTFCRMAGEEQHRLNIEWYNGKCPKELKAQFALTVLPAPKQPNIEL